MEIFEEISPLRAFLKGVRIQGKTCGLVPTMGALHQGHISLLETAKRENSLTICSIYVNPTQFNNAGDLASYPRAYDNDCQLLEKVGCDVLFCPSNKTMYPDEPILGFDFGHLNQVMEGRFRPGHFSGVALVVAKLLNIVQPDRAYFGQKDWQQLTIVSRMVSELKINTEVRSVPTTREPDGLALSSRNLRLKPGQRSEAAIFFHALSYAKKALADDRADFAGIKRTVQNMFNEKENVRLEYLELVESANLKPITDVDLANRPIICIAGYVGEVRLIDNMFLDLSSGRTA
jgi:pantoate--beta-alanine ligase